jgi:hypothetical protein
MNYLIDVYELVKENPVEEYVVLKKFLFEIHIQEYLNKE